jgi:hypothetical protein
VVEMLRWDLSYKQPLISPLAHSQNRGITPLIEINKSAAEDLKARGETLEAGWGWGQPPSLAKMWNLSKSRD